MEGPQAALVLSLAKKEFILAANDNYRLTFTVHTILVPENHMVDEQWLCFATITKQADI